MSSPGGPTGTAGPGAGAPGGRTADTAGVGQGSRAPEEPGAGPPGGRTADTAGVGQGARAPEEPGAGPPGGRTAWSSAPSPRNRLADALRGLIQVTVGRDVDDTTLDAVAQEAERLRATLEAAAAPGKRNRVFPEPDAAPQDYFPTSPMIGFENPLAPPVVLDVVTGPDGAPELRGTATFGYAYEGPPTCVHGGVIAELFDELLGSVNILSGTPGMTGTLTIRYRRPTPLATPVTVVARTLRREGRKVMAWGGIYHQGEITAEAEAIFVVAGPSKMLQIAAANAAAAQGDVLGAEVQAIVEAVARGKPTPGGPAEAPSPWTPAEPAPDRGEGPAGSAGGDGQSPQA